jgi:hypothetical protein
MLPEVLRPYLLDRQEVAVKPTSPAL